MAGNDEQITDIIEEMYSEINTHTKLAATATLPNPYTDFSTWTGRKLDRFAAVIQHLEKEYALIVMYSQTFVDNLSHAPDPFFNDLCNTIANYKTSIRMFAWTRQLDFYTHFNSSAAALQFGHLPEQTPFPDNLHGHTYYLGSNGAIINATWENAMGTRYSLRNETETIYDAEAFSGAPVP
ncbi:hypothetical protein B7494_g5381, partial [Chlorociboria aeruginascens]